MPGYEEFGSLYGHASKLSHHHQNRDLLARQIISIDKDSGDILFAHLKPYSLRGVKGFYSKFLSIMFFTRSIGECAEDIFSDELDDLYFLKRQNGAIQSNFNIPEQMIFESLLKECSGLFSS